jgi:putative transposase
VSGATIYMESRPEVLYSLKWRCTKSLRSSQLPSKLLEYIPMERLFQPLLFFLARCSRNQLIRQIEFLRAENELLRKRLPKRRIRITLDEQKRLIKLGTAVGPGLHKLITIVAPSTYRRWIRNLNNRVPKKRTGRPRTPEAIRELVLKIAKETHWGYTRILGELRKLGYTGISRQTVVNILKREGIDPWPQRGPGTWDELLKIHAETLWQCDFFSKRLVSRRGIRQAFALAFINIATRRVWVSPSTLNPTTAWVEEQARAFTKHAEGNALKVGLVTRDRDRNYRQAFDNALRAKGADVMTLSYRSPNLNAYVERFVQSIQQECLDHFLIFGEKHFDYLVREYVEHYHTERPHQGLGNRVIADESPPAPLDSNDNVLCRTRLGGLLKHYHRTAA